nr:MAG TPA: hypothetical protein [Caudoviricetes sp.]DAX10780.1 MAG TPA: hypothetical protein [Bacteriophage sp.]
MNLNRRNGTINISELTEIIREFIRRYFQIN